MQSRKTGDEVTHLAPAEAEALLTRLDKVIEGFRGQFDELESAIGMLVIGRLVGWKVLALVHNKRTIRKYEEILGINIRDAFPEEGPLAHKSAAYELVKKLGHYWRAVSGDVRVDHRRQLDA